MFTFPKDVLIIDFETTGIVPGYHDPIQIAAVRLNKLTLEEVASFESKIKPMRPQNATLEALKVSGRTMEDLEELVRTAPTPAEVLKAFEMAIFGKYTPPDKKAFYSFDVVLAGQNVKFDIGFLNALLEENGYSRDRYGYHDIDTMTLCFVAQGTMGFKTEKGRLNLDAQAQAFGIPRGAEHDALEDVRVTAEVFRRYVRGIQKAHNAYLWVKENKEEVMAVMKVREEKEEVANDLRDRVVAQFDSGESIELSQEGATQEAAIAITR